MSPEHAEMSGLGVDTRTDIYAVGVLLYELLVGKTPFDAKELIESGLDEMRRTIREKEPIKPSTRLTQTLVAADVRRLKSPSPDTQGSEEEVRASSRRLLRIKETITLLKGDLDWIVMKCLEKDRTRRYATVNDLAADLKRHLNNEPVVARPPSTAYRLQKAFRRNKLIFSAGMAVAAALLAFSPDGKRLATGSVGNPVRIWDCVTGKIVKTLSEKNVVSLAFARDGQTLGVGGRDKVVLWNLENEQIVFKQEEVLGQFRIAFSPVGTLLVIGKHGGPNFDDGGSAELWNYVAHEKKQVFLESGGHIALSLRGDRLATGNTNQTIIIWDVASGQSVRSFEDCRGYRHGIVTGWPDPGDELLGSRS
jgi:WD40 repeat protein